MRNLLLGTLIGLMAGLWAGVNLGKGQDIWENPFNDNSLNARLKESSRDIGDALKDSADALRDSIK